jgi:hypothetical protein
VKQCEHIVLKWLCLEYVAAFNKPLERDDFPLYLFVLSMISAQMLRVCRRENRYPPRIKCGAGFFRIMLWPHGKRCKVPKPGNEATCVLAVFAIAAGERIGEKNPGFQRKWASTADLKFLQCMPRILVRNFKSISGTRKI